MGLTIHYSLRSTAKTAERAGQLVEKMRQLAFDLPFDRVDAEVVYLGPEVCQRPLDDLRSDEELFATVLDATTHGVACPWGRARHMSFSCQPLELFSFSTVPGPGSEWASFGLARYPAELEVEYRPHDDDQFAEVIESKGCTSWEFSWKKWRRWLTRQGRPNWVQPDDPHFQERRGIKTGLGSGWRYGSFCKTQYASAPRCGGVPNFLKCHISLVTLLDRIAALPTVKVEINDEGNYGSSYFSDDCREARAAGRKPHYAWHAGQYSVSALVREIGQWNEMIAGMFGALNDLLKAHGSTASLAGPIQSHSDFERLEFKARDNPDLLPFLTAMDELAKQARCKESEVTA